MKVLFTHTHATLVKQSNTKLLVNISQCQLSSSTNIVLLYTAVNSKGANMASN